MRTKCRYISFKLEAKRLSPDKLALINEFYKQ